MRIGTVKVQQCGRWLWRGVAWRGDSGVCVLSQMAARVGVSIRRCWNDGESLCSPAPVCLRSDRLEAML